MALAMARAEPIFWQTHAPKNTSNGVKRRVQWNTMLFSISHEKIRILVGSLFGYPSSKGLKKACPI